MILGSDAACVVLGMLLLNSAVLDSLAGVATVVVKVRVIAARYLLLLLLMMLLVFFGLVVMLSISVVVLVLGASCIYLSRILLFFLVLLVFLIIRHLFIIIFNLGNVLKLCLEFVFLGINLSLTVAIVDNAIDLTKEFLWGHSREELGI